MGQEVMTKAEEAVKRILLDSFSGAFSAHLPAAIVKAVHEAEESAREEAKAAAVQRPSQRVIDHFVVANRHGMESRVEALPERRPSEGPVGGLCPTKDFQEAWKVTAVWSDGSKTTIKNRLGPVGEEEA